MVNSESDRMARWAFKFYIGKLSASLEYTMTGEGSLVYAVSEDVGDCSNLFLAIPIAKDNPLRVACAVLGKEHFRLATCEEIIAKLPG